MLQLFARMDQHTDKDAREGLESNLLEDNIDDNHSCEQSEACGSIQPAATGIRTSTYPRSKGLCYKNNRTLCDVLLYGEFLENNGLVSC